jgi:hypothetical protein
MWQIVEYTMTEEGEPINLGVVQSDMTQSEAIDRAQRMNDAIDFHGLEGEVYYVAERI